MKCFRCLLVIFLAFAVAPRLWCDETAEGLYQKGMDAYLQGDDDHAILWTAKSLEIEPSFKKAHDLLSVLVVEKEHISQTEIWLGQKTPRYKDPGVADNSNLIELDQRLTGLRTRMDMLERRAREGQLERRFQVVVTMLQKTAAEQYQELKGDQVKALEKIDRIGVSQKAFGQLLFWLLILVLISLLLSLWAVLRRREATSPRLFVEKE
jgi:hypothetical protein